MTKNVFQGGYCVDCSCQAFPEGCSCNTDGDCPNGEFCVDCNCNKFPKGCDCEANSGTPISGVASFPAVACNEDDTVEIYSLWTRLVENIGLVNVFLKVATRLVAWAEWQL